MGKTTLDAVAQEIKDFKSEVLSNLKEIKEQVKKTNGRVNQHNVDISLISQSQKDCSARLYHQGMNRKDWVKVTIPAILSALLTAGAIHLIG